MLLAVMMVGLLSITNAQYKPLATVAGDTIITSSSRDTVVKYVSVTGDYSTASFKVKYTKISGTVALKAYIYPGDGTDYETAATDSSAAFSDASGYLYLNKAAPPYTHYRIEFRNPNGAVSTQSVKIVVSQCLKKYDGR